MNEMYFKISSIEKKMDSNKALKTMMKAVAVIVVFVIFACSFDKNNNYSLNVYSIDI